MTRLAITAVVLALAACSGEPPRVKDAQVDAATGVVTPPYPCPDWSSNTVRNYGNHVHSNYGCATNHNMALQVEDPRDLHRGHGDGKPDASITSRVIERYRAGELPAPLTPQQATGR